MGERRLRDRTLVAMLPGVLVTLLAACGGDDEEADAGSAGQQAVAFESAMATAGDGPKTLRLEWSVSGRPDHFDVEVNPDGASGFVRADVNDDGEVNESDRLGGDAQQATLALPLHRVDFDAALYRLVARDEAGSELASSRALGLAELPVSGLIGYFKAANTDPGDAFGARAALSDDGRTLAVGAPREDGSETGVGADAGDNGANGPGAVYVFTRRGVGAWAQQAYIKASNTGAGDRFGSSLALSANGDTLVVGAPGEDSSGTGPAGEQDNDDARGSGAVYAFVRDAAGQWTQQAYIKASNTGAGDAFGSSVALSGAGDTLAVGADGEASAATDVGGDQADDSADLAGAVYAFRRDSDGNWSQRAYIKASNTGADDLFGASVALSSSGDTLAVGADGEASAGAGVGADQGDDTAAAAGAVYVYLRDDTGVWSQQAYIKASNAGAGDAFGGSVDLSGAGDTLLVGARGEASAGTGPAADPADDSADDAGAAYVLIRDGAGAWSEQAYLKASNAGAGDGFGSHVALAANAGLVAVAAPGEDGSGTAFTANPFEDTAPEAGAFYTFARDGAGDWSQQRYAKAPNTAADDILGHSVALSASGDVLAAGAPGESGGATGVGGDPADNTANGAGTLYLY